MRPGRELDTLIAQEVFNHQVFVKQKVLHERTSLGDRPLRNYSKEIQWAWEVARKMHISLIPIDDGTWFAMTGKQTGWRSPAEFIEYLATGNFVEDGAAVGEHAALTICMAAMKAIDNRKRKKAEDNVQQISPQTH